MTTTPREFPVLAMRSRNRGERERYERIAELYVRIAGELEELMVGGLTMLIFPATNEALKIQKNSQTRANPQNNRLFLLVSRETTAI